MALILRLRKQLFCKTTTAYNNIAMVCMGVIFEGREIAPNIYIHGDNNIQVEILS